MKSDNKSGFAVNDKPYVVFNTSDLYNRFISMPFIGMQIQERHEPDAHIVKQRCEFSTPVADSGMRHRNVKYSAQNQADISKRIFAKEKHAQSTHNQMNGIAHSLEVVLAEKLRHGGAVYDSGFPYKERVVTLFVTATIMAVVFVIVVQEGGFSTNWA